MSRPRISIDDRSRTAPFTPDILREAPAARPLVAGPAGPFGTVPLPNVQSETSIAASGSQVVVGYNDFRPPFRIGILYSADGGATFNDGGRLGVPAGGAVYGDPGVAVWNPPAGPAVFYCSHLGANPAGNNVIFFHRSTDGGVTWSGPFEVTSATVPDHFPDRASIAVDPETGRLLVAWTHFDASFAVTIRVAHSDDAATGVPPTWSAAAIVGSRPQDGQATTIVCNPTNDQVYLAWQVFPGYPARAIAFVRSANNGNSWPTPSDLGPGFFTHLCPFGFDRWLWSFSGGGLAYNPADGGLEMVYAGSVDGTPAHDFGDIYYRRSTNGGNTWSAPVALNAFPGADRPQANPCVSVTHDGRIDVFWYDLSAGNGLDDLTDVFYTYSANFGASWSSPVPVNPEPFHNEAGNNFSGPHQGDYNDAFSDPLTSGPGYAAFAVMAEPSPTTTGPDGFAFTAQGVQVAPLRVRPGTVSLADHGCDDGFLVANEWAELTIPLENIGRTTLTGITASLSALAPSIGFDPAPRSYPALASGASGTSSATFQISLAGSYPCGTRARFRLDVGATGVSPSYVEFSIPTGTVASSSTLLSETFDGVVAPALPAGWTTSTVDGASNPWITTETVPASGPNAAFCNDLPTTSFERLAGPAVVVPAGTTSVEVTFDTQYALEEFDARFGFDGLAFDYQLDGDGDDHLASGDAIEFDSRYSHNLSRDSGNAGDRSAWSGASTPYKTVRIVILGLAGHTLRPFFDLTSDGGVGSTGAWVDNLKIQAITLDCGACQPTAVPIAGSDSRGLGLELRGPNPFASGTRLRYRLPAPTQVRIEVFDLAGHRVRTLVDGWQETGEHEIALLVRDGSVRPMSPGVYFVRITAAGESRSLRLVALD
jgi:hypothetical protein